MYRYMYWFTCIGTCTDVHIPVLTCTDVHVHVQNMKIYMIRGKNTDVHVPVHVHQYMSEVGTHNFFFSPQSQLRNLKDALPQSQFRNFLKKCCSTTAIPQSQFFMKSATSSPQLESFTSAIFGRFLAWSSLKLYIYLLPGVFCYWLGF
jgi:hypothetical protein